MQAEHKCDIHVKLKKKMYLHLKFVTGLTIKEKNVCQTSNHNINACLKYGTRLKVLIDYISSCEPCHLPARYDVVASCCCALMSVLLLLYKVLL